MARTQEEATTEYTILASIATLLGFELFRIRAAPRITYELRATLRSSCAVFIRLDQTCAFLEFFVKNVFADFTLLTGFGVLVRLELAKPGDLTRAKLRAAIKETERLCYEKQREQRERERRESQV